MRNAFWRDPRFSKISKRGLAISYEIGYFVCRVEKHVILQGEGKHLGGYKMRLIKTQVFQIGKKIPYSEWPGIVHRYLREQGLSSGKFLYYFMDLWYSPEFKQEYGIGAYGCDRLAKDLPAIGAPREHNDSDNSGVHDLFISNIDTNGSCSEAQIMPLMKKIHRSYGLVESDLYYLDVDFFSQVIPAGRDLRFVEDFCRRSERPFDPFIRLADQPYGSGFRLYRYSTGGNYLSLSIDILRNGVVADPSDYFAALQVMLPGIRHTEHLDIYPSDSDQQEFDRLNTAAEPAVERCRGWLGERLPAGFRQNHFPSNYNLAPKLKKLAKQYGLSYSFHGDGVFTLDRKTKLGHILRMNVDSGPSRFDTSFSLNFQGLGFRHSLHYAQFTPTNQEEFDACAEQVLSVMADFEEEMLPALDACWPQTPDWYIPKF